ncbi:MAG: ATP-binding cassette domain-containing protein [Planctomycetaceae bacterium]|nr:ATP-binding cassette domain-containing protein [Planctomycetaceae bacterium]
MPLLSVEGLVKNYGRRRVVDGVDFHVETGEIVGLLGPNGAGKTTSFRMTCGMVIPDSGRPKERRRRCEELLEQFDIVKIRRSRAHYISGGEKRRLEIARCLVTEPRIILLDEPFTGIDPVTIHSIQKIIKGLRDDGISILITDHRERETLAITDRSYVIRAGKVLCHGTAQEVLSNPDAKKYYFGESPGVEAA